MPIIARLRRTTLRQRLLAALVVVPLLCGAECGSGTGPGSNEWTDDNPPGQHTPGAKKTPDNKPKPPSPQPNAEPPAADPGPENDPRYVVYKVIWKGERPMVVSYTDPTVPDRVTPNTLKPGDAHGGSWTVKVPAKHGYVYDIHVEPLRMRDRNGTITVWIYYIGTAVNFAIYQDPPAILTWQMPK